VSGECKKSISFFESKRFTIVIRHKIESVAHAFFANNGFGRAERCYVEVDPSLDEFIEVGAGGGELVYTLELCLAKKFAQIGAEITTTDCP